MASAARGLSSPGPAESPSGSVAPASGKAGGTASQSDIDAMLAEMADEEVGRLAEAPGEVVSGSAADEPDLDAVLADAREALSRETGGAVGGGVTEAEAKAARSGADVVDKPEATDAAIASSGAGNGAEVLASAGAGAEAGAGGVGGVGEELDALFEEINKSSAEINALAGEVVKATGGETGSGGGTSASGGVGSAGVGAAGAEGGAADAAVSGDVGLDTLIDEINKAGVEINELAEEAGRAVAATPEVTAASGDASAGGSDLDALFDEINKAGAEIDKLVQEAAVGSTPTSADAAPITASETATAGGVSATAADAASTAADAAPATTDAEAISDDEEVSATALLSDSDGAAAGATKTLQAGPLVVEGVGGAEPAGVPEHKGPPFLCATDDWKPLSDELELAGGFDVIAALPEVKKDHLGWLTRPLIALLVAVNRPVEGLSPRARTLVGGIGLVTLVNAVAVLGWLWWARLRG